MNGLPYYKRYPRDFIEGTIGMPFELKVTYSFVLDLIYMQGGKLPDDSRYIAGLLGVSVRKWKALRDGLISAGKLQAGAGYLTNYRAVSELETLAKLQDKQRENASGPRKNKGLQKPRPNHTEPEPDIRKREAKASPKRGARLPPDWTLPRAWGVWAQEQGWPDASIRDQADRFRDYWHSVPGQKGVKLDWLATWRNWMRNSSAPKIVKGDGYEPSKSKNRLDAFVAGARGSS